MTDISSLERAKAAALWRVGRNLLCLQQIEATLRSLVPHIRTAGTLAQVQAQLREGRKETKKASLGTLSSTYEKRTLNGPVEVTDQEPGDEAYISVSSSIAASPEVLREMKS